MFKIFKKKTPEEKLIILKCNIASMEREVEVMWKLENRGGYLIGNRDEITALEKRLAYSKKELELKTLKKEM